MPAVKFGVGFAPNTPAPRVIEAAQLAENLGYDVFWLTDSHLVGREAIALLGALAVSTRTIHLGPGVSHLAGRHPSVIASAMATLAELAPGRIRLGIGVGDTGPLNLGVPRTSLRDLEQAVVDIRALIHGQATPGSTRPLQLGFGAADKDVPIYIAGSAQRTQRLAGRVADGALISGMPDNLPQAIANVRAGEQEAQPARSPETTRILLWTTVAVDDDRAAARAAVHGSVARRAMNAFARATDLDPRDAEPLQRLRDAHSRGRLWDADYAALVPDHWVDLFAIAGTPAEVRERLERAVAQGADEISLILVGPGAGDRGGAAQLRHFAITVMQPMQRLRIGSGM
jgi:5,10-methylenetetrahydromethanopterin reductase